MESVWIDIALAISCAACGGVCGWVSHAFGGQASIAKRVQMDNETGPSATGVVEHEEVRRDEASLVRVAETLQAHAESMSDNVDVHQQRVDLISDQLTGTDETTPELIAEMVQQIIEANQAMQTQLRSAQDQIHQQTLALATAEQKAKTDALTRIANRGAFDDHLAKRHRVGPPSTPELPHAGVLALLDVDHFKKFNDVYGHLAGDEVLRVVAGLMHHRLNRYGIVARYGGEEFAVILDNHTIESAGPILEKVRREIGQREIIFEDQRLHVTASMGVAMLQPNESTEGWIERADSGLYVSKEAGRDCGHAVTPEGSVRITLDDDVSSNSPGGGIPTSSSSGVDPTAPDSSATNFPTSGAAIDDVGKPSPLSYLPDRDAMEQTFREIRDRSSDVELSLMLLRCPDDTPIPKLKSLLPVVRSNLRNVDKLGCFDDETLMVVLPSVQPSAARSRGLEMVAAAETIGLAEERVLRMGVANLEPNETFDELLANVLAQVDAT